MADRRRINGPGGNTVPPVFESDEVAVSGRTRAPNGIRAQCELTQFVLRLVGHVNHEQYDLHLTRSQNRGYPICLWLSIS
jgi:hypothetical protein